MVNTSDKAFRRLVDQMNYMYPLPAAPTRRAPGTEVPSPRATMATQCPQSKSQPSWPWRKFREILDNKAMASMHQCVKRIAAVVDLLYTWIVWEAKRAAVGIFDAALAQWFRLLFEARIRKWQVGCKFWECRCLVRDVLKPARWRIKALRWHAKTRSARGLMMLRNARNYARNEFTRQLKDLRKRAKIPRCPRKLYGAVICCKFFKSGHKDLTQSEKGIGRSEGHSSGVETPKRGRRTERGRSGSSTTSVR